MNGFLPFASWVCRCEHAAVAFVLVSARLSLAHLTLPRAAPPAAQVWNLTNCKLKSNLVGHTGYVNTVTVSPDGSLCASGGKVRLRRICVCSGARSQAQAHQQHWVLWWGVLGLAH